MADVLNSLFVYFLLEKRNLETVKKFRNYYALFKCLVKRKIAFK